MYNVQDSSVLYNNVLQLVICEGWYCICITFKIVAFFILTLFGWLYVRVDFGNVTTVRCKRCGHSKYECAGLFIRCF